MKYLILAGLLLVGCGGGGSSLPETVTETIVEQVPIIERECAEPETIYVVEEVIKEVIKEVYVYPEPVIPYVMSRIELDEDGDGTIDRLYIDRNITDGLVMEEYVNTVGTTGTSIYIGTWTYNEAGYPLTYISYSNGVLSRTNTWEYDEYNNVIRQTELNEPTQSWFYEYINDEIVSIYSDYEDDGVYDSAIFYTHDNNGNRITVTYDRENDGIVDEIRHNTWVEGRQASVTLPN